MALGHQPGADDEDGGREADLLLAFKVVGGRTTFDVDRTILNQGNAISRRNRHQAGVDFRHLQLALDAIDNLEHQFMRVANDLLLVVVI